MDAKSLEERLMSIRGGEWGWLNAKLYFAQLIQRLEKHGIAPDEVDDILSVALTAAIEDAKWQKG